MGHSEHMTQVLLTWAGLFSLSFHSLPQLQPCSNPKRIQMRVLVICSLLRHCQCVFGKAAGTEVAENGQVSASVFEQGCPGYTALLSLLEQGKQQPRELHLNDFICTPDLMQIMIVGLTSGVGVRWDFGSLNRLWIIEGWKRTIEKITVW